MILADRCFFCVMALSLPSYQPFIPAIHSAMGEARPYSCSMLQHVAVACSYIALVYDLQNSLIQLWGHIPNPEYTHRDSRQFTTKGYQGSWDFLIDFCSKLIWQELFTSLKYLYTCFVDVWQPASLAFTNRVQKYPEIITVSNRPPESIGPEVAEIHLHVWQATASAWVSCGLCVRTR